ncbi:MAG: pyridoxal phosphate-dependent aminotransferase [Halobacteriaceae archaeon]
MAQLTSWSDYERGTARIVVDLSVGEPDFDTPENIKRAGKDALDQGHTTYTSAAGLPELRETIAERLLADDLHYDPSQVIVTPGAKHALYIAFQTLVDVDDEVTLIDPSWVSYEPMARLADGSVNRVDLSRHGFRLEDAIDAVAEKTTSGTTAIVINSPNNPSGAIFSDAALEGVRDIAIDNDVTVISDEIYEDISYDVEPTSIGSLDGMEDRTITINGFSKSYAMTGWRLGYLAGPEDLVAEATKVQSHSVSCTANFVQRAGIEALRNTDRAVAEMVNAFAERRELVIDLCKDLNLDHAPLRGAFYALISVDEDDEEWCTDALEDAHVATVPGSAFGTPGYARFSYAASKDRIKEGFDRLETHGFL